MTWQWPGSVRTQSHCALLKRLPAVPAAPVSQDEGAASR